MLDMIKKRWSEGVIFLGWLATLFYFFSERVFIEIGTLSYGVPSPYRLIEVMVIFYIAPLILTWLFLSSVENTEGKIINSTFSYKWLIRSYLVKTLFFYAVVFVLLLPSIYQLIFHGAALELAALRFTGNLLFWLIATPIIPLLVYLLPALFFHKFFQDVRIRGIFTKIAIILLLLSFASVITLKNTCNLGSDEECVISKAMAANYVPLSLCEGMKTDQGSYSCYSVATKYITDFEDCYKIPAESQRRSCIFQIAEKTKDSRICDKLEELSSRVSRDTRGRCYEAIGETLVSEAIKTGICDNISDPASNVRCIIGVAKDTRDPRICFQFKGKTAYDEEIRGCLRQVLSKDIRMDQQVFDYYMTQIRENKPVSFDF